MHFILLPLTLMEEDPSNPEEREEDGEVLGAVRPVRSREEQNPQPVGAQKDVLDLHP